ncbi:oligopeptide/dipeptide ABC transporter ATP-binding protein [Yinghuangia aomiensis]
MPPTHPGHRRPRAWSGATARPAAASSTRWTTPASASNAAAVLGIVGESGCGKSTLARLLTRPQRPDDGTADVLGTRIDNAKRDPPRRMRRTIQLCPPGPRLASLDPRRRDRRAATRRSPRRARLCRRAPSGSGYKVLLAHEARRPGRRRLRRALPPTSRPAASASAWASPARLAVRPDVLVLDEPVSALDVSVRAEIMNLLVHLREELGLTFVFISHDLGMVRHFADEIAVMYLGKIVEIGPWDAVSDEPLHPTPAPCKPPCSFPGPTLGTRPSPRTGVTGEVPDAAVPPTGCRFHPRCPLAGDVCRTEEPALLPVPVFPEGRQPAVRGTPPRLPWVRRRFAETAEAAQSPAQATAHTAAPAVRVGKETGE